MTHLNLNSNPHRVASLVVFLMVIFGWLTLSPTARAYHFFYVKPPTPAKWASLPVNFVVDNGPTSILPEIQTAFNAWNNISTAKNVLGTPTLATGDFNAANFNSVWGITGDGKNEVVFDEDGAALANFGYDPASVNGYGPSKNDVAAGTVIDAFLVINGKRTDFDRQSTEVHELGHIQGLAHSSVGLYNSGSFASDALDPISISAVPTMHPFSTGTGTNRRTPEADDIAALSELYPEASFATSFGTIQGTVTRCGGDKTVTGANVRAVNVSNPSIQLSRFTGFDGNGEGRFVINGVPPGNYRLVVEGMGFNRFTISSNGSFAPPPFAAENDFPTEYYNPPAEETCSEELPDTAVNVAVTAGGNATGKNFKVGSIDLAFVVDDTGSMSNEIGGVRTALTQFVNIMDNINRLTGIRFPNTAVITFKDDVTKRVVSSDPARLKTVIGALVASGGGDCSEASNAAVLTAGGLLKKGGVAILFTDADSRSDGPARNTVTQLYRSKSLTLATLLSGTCTGSLAAPAEATQPLLPIDQTAPPAGSDFDELQAPPTLGVESGVRTFSEESILTGGIFTSIPGIKTGGTLETQRYINTGTNLSVSSVVPAVSLVSPGDGPQTGTFNIEIFGSNTNFQTSSSVSIAGGGITVNSRAIDSPEKITANITVQSGATLGFRDVTVTTPLGTSVTETATGFGAFNVVVPPASPRIVGVAPSQGGQGASLNVSISGITTHFVNGVSVANFGPGVTVNSTTVLSSTAAVASITVTPTAAIGLRDVVVTTGSETANEIVVGPFLVSAPPPLIPLVTLINPALGKQEQTLNVAITGNNTNFVNGTSVASFSGSGIVVNSTTVSSAVSATANITIGSNATLGFRDVFVTTGTEVASSLSSFQVTCNPLTSPQVLQFDAATFSVPENSGTVLVTITRNSCEATGSLSINFGTGDTAGSQNCSTLNGIASSRCDYIASIGTVRFAAGETTKTFPILIVDDSYAEGNETFTIGLSNPVGASLGTQSSTTVTIVDNDTVNAPNLIDAAGSFVRQHYFDFLNRQADPSGLAFWTNEITSCGSNQSCIDAKRVNVSAAYFLSIEFQQTGYLVERLYKTAYGDGVGTSTFGSSHTLPVPIVRLNEFLPDTQQISQGIVVGQTGWEQAIENNKVAFTAEFVQRARFTSAFPTSMTPEAFVTKLYANAGLPAIGPTFVGVITLFSGAGNTVDLAARARALRSVAENSTLVTNESNRAFVLMQFFGYLRRNPNDPQDTNYTGYDFWLTKLNQFNGNFVNADMVKAFITSAEYRQRFGP